jgi:ParB/RepB/Spo0J family partition protein
MADNEITDNIGTEHFASELMRLRLDDVVPSASNPRRQLEKEPFAELKKSIRENGLLQPIVVRPVNGRYEIIGGHRRFAAICELSKENPADERFARIAAQVIDADDAQVGVLRLAENVNRADLSPIEVAAAVAATLESGASADAVAAGLGWNRRQLNRHVQLHQAPEWLKDFAREVKAPKTRKDERGAVVVDAVTQRPVVDVEIHAGLEFSHLFELLTAYNVLRQEDAERLAEGGDGFKPRAERVVRRLAASAASEHWGVARLSGEIKKVKTGDAGVARPTTKKLAPIVATNDTRAVIQLREARASTGEAREKLTAELTAMLAGIGYRVVVLKI